MAKASARYKCFVIMRYNNGEEPTITVFSNKTAAQICLMYSIDLFDHVFVEECPVYGKFLVGDEINNAN